MANQTPPTLRAAIEALRDERVVDAEDIEWTPQFIVHALTAALALPDAGEGGTLHQRITAAVETFEMLGKPSREYMLQRLKQELATPADTPAALSAEVAEMREGLSEVWALLRKVPGLPEECGLTDAVRWLADRCLSDVERGVVVTLCENAVAEVDHAIDSEGHPQPDDPMALMASYDIARQIIAKCRTHAEPETGR